MLAKHFTMGAKSRSNMVTRYNQAPGQYYLRTTPKGITINYAFLPCATTFEHGGTTIDAYVVSISNMADMAKTVIIPSDSLSSSSIHLVTAELAKKLPKGIPKGQSFSGTTKKAADIKSFLPDAAEKYVLIIMPNTHPIPPGESSVIKGHPNDGMADIFREMGTLSSAWLKIMANLDEDVVKFNVDLQNAAITNKATLAQHFPGATIESKLVFLTPYAILHQVPLDEDEDSELAGAEQELAILLQACKMRNNPAPIHTPGQPPSTVGGIHDDYDSILSSPQASTQQPNANTKRIEAKLRLIGAAFSPDMGLTLPELEDQIKSTVALGNKLQADAMANILASNSNKQADTLDCINRYSGWPGAYRFVP